MQSPPERQAGVFNILATSLSCFRGQVPMLVLSQGARIFIFIVRPPSHDGTAG